MAAARLALAAMVLAVSAAVAPAAPAGQKPVLHTLADVNRALRACWRWPPLSEARSSMEMTVRVSFKRSGDLLGARITYQTPDVPDAERSAYQRAMLAALSRCTPLPLSKGLGGAIAGRPLIFHIHDTRQQRKV